MASNLNIHGLSIPYIILDNKKSKYIKLSIDINGLRVITPPKTSALEVEKVLRSKSNWIYKHYNKLRSMKVNGYKRKWESGETILYKGDRYDIHIFSHDKSNIAVKFNGRCFQVAVNDMFGLNDREFLIESSFKKWYKEAAYKVIKDRLEYYCKLTGQGYNTIRIKEQKTLWGSCSRKRNLNFNWKLIMAPQWVMDYVILHEVCHLKYLNHSKNYWNMVEMYMPNYREAKVWLKTNAISLSLLNTSK